MNNFVTSLLNRFNIHARIYDPDPGNLEPQVSCNDILVLMKIELRIRVDLVL
jgi:hypothetical protein